MKSYSRSVVPLIVLMMMEHLKKVEVQTLTIAISNVIVVMKILGDSMTSINCILHNHFAEQYFLVSNVYKISFP